MGMMMKASDMDDLQKRLDAATPGPWSYTTDDQYCCTVDSNIGEVADLIALEANAALIALAPDLARRVIAADRHITELLAWAPPEEQARVMAEWEASK